MNAVPQTDLSLRMRVAPRLPGTLLPLSLSDGQVDVWPADLADTAPLDAWEAFLSPEEQERVRRFHFPADFRRYVYGRGLLRWLLASYLETDPARIQFTYSPEGKPEVVPGPAHRQLHFNLSHSGTKLLLAFAWERQVGADVERLRSDIELEQIATRFFSYAEQSALLSLPPAQRTAAFFRCWTRKEAYVKATGKGLSLPLGQFDVSLLPEHPAALLATRPNAQEAEHWLLHGLELGPGYAAAVAVERSSNSRP